MPRPATGQVIEPKDGRAWALRFRAGGQRRYVTLGTGEESWNRQKAEAELRHVLADVDRGLWRPHKPTPAPMAAEMPTFHVFASEWLRGKRTEVREGTAADYQWALELHLLPHFARYRLDEITIEVVDQYKRRTAREGKLSPAIVNKTLTRLAQILEDAVEYGHLDRNPARGRRRRLKVDRPRAIYIDTASQIVALLDAASAVDGGPRARTSGRRALIATLVFGGLRVTEACQLRWRDVDLGSGRINVRESKTSAGVRQVDILPILRDELTAYRPEDAKPESPVFTTGRGTSRNKDNVARRVMKPVTERADELLEDRDEALLPEGITAHKLRHTYGSLLAACGEDPSYVMAQLGHSDPKFTLRVYTHLMSRRDGERERLKALVEGADWAAMGSESGSDEPMPTTPVEEGPAESASESEIRAMGVTGLEPVTSSLSSWRSPN
jgi:integrase